jgi:hemoglobin/transferrin/lactoferrin receptor protein
MSLSLFFKLRAAPRSAALVMMFLPLPLAAQLPERTVTVVVRDSLTRVPLSGVRVTAGRHSAVSDAEGRFSLRVQAANDTTTLMLRRVGYSPRSIPMSGLGAELLLAPTPQLLTELTASEAPAAPAIGRGSALGVAQVEREAIAVRGETVLADALASHAEGVSAQHPGAWGAKAFVRGLGGERVTVLLDGDRINRGCNIGMDQGLATVDPSTVERVEVISGPGSVLYGSGNVGGVINVVTRPIPEDRGQGGELRVGASSAVPGGTVGGTFSLRRDRLALSLSGDAASYNDYRSAAGTVEGSSFRDATLDGRVEWTPAPAHRVEARVQRYAGRDIGYPATAGATIPKEDRLLTALDYGWQLSRGALDALSVKVYRQGIDHDMVMSMTMTGSSGMPMTSTTEAITTSVTWGGRLQARLRPLATAHVDAGVEATQWNADGTRWVTRSAGTPMENTLEFPAWPDVRLADAGAFAQGEWAITGPLAVSAGGRLDHVTRRADGRASGDEWVSSGNVGVRVFPFEGFETRVSLGYGYRVPDPTELYGLVVRPDGFIYSGNADLVTETSRNLEASARFTRGAFDLGATVYRNDLYDLISTVLVADSTLLGFMVRQYQNVTRARVEGVTARVGAELGSGLAVRGTMGWARGDNLDTGAALPLIPPLEGTAAVRYSASGLLQWAEVESRMAATQDRAATAQGEVVTPGFATVNARVNFTLWNTGVLLGADNLLDKAYRNHLDPVRLLMPGRNFYLRLRRTI